MAKFEEKEHIWYLEQDGEEKIFKCLVREDECVTYLGDQEHKHLKVTNPVRKDGVLQIDTVTAVYGQQVGFQLENGVPYIHWDGGWKMSETNRQDRIAKTIQIQKISSWMMIGGAVLIAAIGSVKNGGNITTNEWVWYAGSGFMGISGMANLANLKNQMNMLKEAEQEEAEKKAERLGKSG